MTRRGTQAGRGAALEHATPPDGSDGPARVGEAHRTGGGAGGAGTGPRGPLGGGRYQLEWLLGRGASSEVFRGHDTLLGRPVAIKLFPTESDGHEAQRRWREVHSLAALNHPRLVSIYDVGNHRGRMFVVLQLVEGGNLNDWLTCGPLSPAQTARLGGGVAAGLAHIHRRGLIHRDVKPANILLDQAGLPCLTDFGLATRAGTPALTEAGLILGTPAYLAPEQVRGAPLGTSADIYALGLVLLECLTGHREYPGDPAVAATARLEHPPDIPDHLPEPITAALRAMTHPQAHRRPAAAELTTYFAAQQRSLPGDQPQPLPTTNTVAQLDPPEPAWPPRAGITGRAPGAPVPRDRAARHPAAPSPPGRPRTVMSAAAALVLLLAVGGGVAATHAAHTPADPTASIAVAAAPPAMPKPGPPPAPPPETAPAEHDGAGPPPAPLHAAALGSDDAQAGDAGLHGTAIAVIAEPVAAMPHLPPLRAAASNEPDTPTRAPATPPHASRAAKPSEPNSSPSNTPSTKPGSEKMRHPRTPQRTGEPRRRPASNRAAAALRSPAIEAEPRYVSVAMS